jgi:hypothetical protein
MHSYEHDPIAFLLQCTQDETYSVYLSNGASDSDVIKLQLTATKRLSGSIPEGYVRFLRIANGAQIENACFESTTNLIDLNLDINYGRAIVLGGSGGVVEYVFDLVDQQYHTINFGRLSEKLKSFSSFGKLLTSVIVEQGVV